MAPTAEATVKPSDLILEANSLDALEDRTTEQQERLDHLKETIDALSAAELDRLSTPAEDLADAQHPDRPEGAADDEPLSQQEREQSGDWQFEGDDPPAAPDPPAAAPTGETSGYTPGQEEPVPGEITAEQAERFKAAAGITGDQAEARGEEPPEAEAAPDGNALFDAGPDSHDLAAWQAIVGGEQATERKIAVKGLPSLTLQNSPAVLKKGAELELRAVVRVTGFSSQDKLKHNLESDELELSDTNEKRTLTIVAATVLTDEPGDDVTAELIEKAVRAGMALRKNANDDTIAGVVAEVIG